MERVEVQTVADILRLIASPPNWRNRPTAEDRAGSFSFWFDGGAASVQTGFVEYVFASGARAVQVAPTPSLSITIEFPGGARVEIRQKN